ncbi:probable LRR receptor-like serine/threonine-protein kinase At1g53420 [Andrographis paniculata]|uniref:probable LRR receptor-like serine/threonine-protein kinase At1g53420 n=1 Tax=Andrographis paniculata TaxID=175694 RepID=UPI0021E715AA|nr:probable LRR receptor-like serine/threonine-protein kinase At1g53420 [Andrographis paniculata]
MESLSLYVSLTLLVSLSLLHSTTSSSSSSQQLVSLLMSIKSALDPQNQILSSWSWSPNNSGSPCTSFQGIACNDQGHVVNISLQGKGLSGHIPPEIGLLTTLSGLYLHFNNLKGLLPKDLANLTHLSDLYLNVNSLSGPIPPQIASIPNLQVLQLCYNKLSGNIPTQIGSMKKLTVLALQSNHLSGAIPASLGNLMNLTRLDLSFNHLFGSIPLRLGHLPMLKLFDVRNNTLSGNVPLAFKRLEQGFQYSNNPALCGTNFPALEQCGASNSTKPEAFGPGTTRHFPSKNIPESANVGRSAASQSGKSHPGVIAAIVGLLVASAVAGALTLTWYRRQKQKIGSVIELGDARLSSDQIREVRRRSASPLVSLVYSNGGWDPLAKGRGTTSFSQEVLESYTFNLEEVETATRHFSEANLLGKSSFSAIYRGVLRDGSDVAVKCISKVSCNSNEVEFVNGLKLLTSLKHENLVRLRGFCCSKGRGECFLVYEFVPNGNLLRYLDAKEDSSKALDWSTRKSIIRGIAKGIEYLHGSDDEKSMLVHQNVSAEKVLMDDDYNPLISDSGIHKLLADDIVFSMLKGSAAMGYLAPEYTTTGRFTEKSDVYAFGMIIFQILSGRSRITQLNCHGAELSKFEDFIDASLAGKFDESEAARLGEVALLCTHERPDHRPDMRTVMRELENIAIV